MPQPTQLELIEEYIRTPPGVGMSEVTKAYCRSALITLGADLAEANLLVPMDHNQEFYQSSYEKAKQAVLEAHPPSSRKFCTLHDCHYDDPRHKYQQPKCNAFLRDATPEEEAAVAILLGKEENQPATPAQPNTGSASVAAGTDRGLTVEWRHQFRPNDGVVVDDPHVSEIHLRYGKVLTLAQDDSGNWIHVQLDHDSSVWRIRPSHLRLHRKGPGPSGGSSEVPSSHRVSADVKTSIPPELRKQLIKDYVELLHDMVDEARSSVEKTATVPTDDRLPRALVEAHPYATTKWFWRRTDPPMGNGVATPEWLHDDPLFSDLFLQTLEEIEYWPGYGLLLAKDRKATSREVAPVDDDGYGRTEMIGRWYFQVEHIRPDSITGELGFGSGGKYYPSPHIVQSELHRALFGLFDSYDHHEAREGFKWKGKAIFGPHISSEALHRVADELDVRPPRQGE